MAASLSRYLLLLLLVLSLGLRAAVPAGFMPGQSHWIDFCPHQGWDSGFLDRIATAHADHDQDGEAQLPHCPWSPLVSEYALIDLRTVLSRPSPQAFQKARPGLLEPQSLGLRLPPARAPPVSLSI